ncbi:MAG: Hpt domain-containing protein, partial [Desulfamplus sp.]|nr:Hpt domain-containing protein [Desulfamplus sp.]
MVEPNNFVEGFRQEAEELLLEIEAAVLDIEENPEEDEAVNRLFRAMHTIKGSGAMFGFYDIAKFTHHVETALDKVREGLIPITRELIDLTLSSRDQIKIMLEASTGGEPADPKKNQEIIDALKILMGEDSEQSFSGNSSPGASSPGRSKKKKLQLSVKPVNSTMTSWVSSNCLVNNAFRSVTSVAVRGASCL